MCRPLLLLALLWSAPALGQRLSLDSLLRAHRYDLAVEAGALTGSGVGFLMDAAQEVQFVAVAEEHNVRELNDLSALLFEALHRRHGFDYVALEQGSVIGSWFGDAERRGDLRAIEELVRRYPHAPTFATDEELRMIASVGATSTAAVNPLWGIDQEFGALHLLERLAALAPSDEAASRIEALAAEARRYERDRFGETGFLIHVLTPDDLVTLPSLIDAAPGSEAALLIEALQRTTRIYYHHRQAERGHPTGYENGREREESMKLRFMEQYRQAQAAGDPLPRVFAKLGHWHVQRGLNRSNVPTFGNFLSEFALSNGLDAFTLSTYVIDSPEAWRNASGALAEAASDAPFTVIDFRPLRPYAHQNAIAGLDENMKWRLFHYDAALIVRGGRTGRYDVVRGAVEATH